LRRSQTCGRRCVGVRTCGPWGLRPRHLESSRRPRVLLYLKATPPLCIRVVWARRGVSPAGCATMARMKRTVPSPGRPSPLLDPSRSSGEPVTRLRRTARCGRTCRRPCGVQHKRPHRGRPSARGTSAMAEGGRESEGGIGASKSGNGLAAGPGRAKAARGDGHCRRAPGPRPRHWMAGHRDGCREWHERHAHPQDGATRWRM
jgi:hypothetical protein